MQNVKSSQDDAVAAETTKQDLAQNNQLSAPGVIK